MRKIEITQTDTASWSASSAGIGTDIERLGMITRIACTAEVTPSATMDGANDVDGLKRVVQNMRLEGGGFTYFTLPGDAGGQGGNLWHLYNRFNMKTVGHGGADITAPSRTFVPMTFWWHPGSFPVWHGRQNEYDLSALVPALHDASLRAIWVTGPNSVMDDIVTISSATMRYTLYYVIGTDSEVRRDMQSQFRRYGVEGLPAFDRGMPSAMVPNWQSLTATGDATYSDYGLEQNIPTGGYLRQMWILAQDATATRPLRAPDEITGVKVSLPGQEIPVQAYTGHWGATLPLGTGLTDAEGAVDFGGHVHEGVHVKDFRNEGNCTYGLNLEHVSSGSAKVGVTIDAYASGDDYLYLFDKLHPYYGLVGFPG